MTRVERELPLIEWEAVSIFESIPQPTTFIDDSPTGWLLWDAAVRAIEQQLKPASA